MFTSNTDYLLGSNLKTGTNNQISQESLDWFIGMLTKSINSYQTEWFEFFRKYKKMILCYKYFSKRNLVSTEELKSVLKFELKKFYTPLQMATDELDFFEKICMLPSRINFIIIRLCFDISKELDNIVILNRKEIREEVKRLRKIRLELAENVNNVSLYYQDVFNVQSFIEVFDNGLLFEDNFINQGINDFFIKLIQDETARKNLQDYKLNSLVINEIEKEITGYVSYTNYKKGISDGKPEFFDIKGQQVGKRFENVIELVKGNEDLTDYVIDFDSRFKEPNSKINYTPANEPEFDEVGELDGEEGAGAVSNSGGGGGGSFSNDADIDVPDFGSPEGGIETGAVESGGEDVNTEEQTDELPDDFGPQ